MGRVLAFLNGHGIYCVGRHFRPKVSVMRLVFLFLAGSVGLYASSIATVSCTLGTETETYSSNSARLTGCQLLYPAPGDLFVMATAYLGDLTVEASAGVTPGIPSSANAGASAYANETESFRSAGPPRSGVIEFAFGGGEQGASATGTISDGVYQYSFDCISPSCSSNTVGPPPPMPFELGTTFTIVLSATAPGFCGDTYCSDGLLDVSSLQLLEANGTTPVNYFPVAVPEPAAVTLFLLAIPAAIWKFRRVVEKL